MSINADYSESVCESLWKIVECFSKPMNRKKGFFLSDFSLPTPLLLLHRSLPSEQFSFNDFSMYTHNIIIRWKNHFSWMWHIILFCLISSLFLLNFLCALNQVYVRLLTGKRCLILTMCVLILWRLVTKGYACVMTQERDAKPGCQNALKFSQH
jgi:hypothetical protein